MGKQLSPVAVAAAIAVLVLVIGFAVWKFTANSGYEAKVDTEGTQKIFDNYKKTGKMPGITVPVKH